MYIIYYKEEMEWFELLIGNITQESFTSSNIRPGFVLNLCCFTENIAMRVWTGTGGS